jgi:hypothetical protein
MKRIDFWVGLVGAIALALYVALGVSGDAHTKITTAVEYMGLIVLFLFGFLVLIAIATGRIDISGLLEEKGDGGAGKASMSRFQLLVFTFVIAICLFLIVVNSEEHFPDIPINVLLLLGISATTYGVSKGIQASAKSDGATHSTTSSTTTESTTTHNEPPK